jgi:hypothetical protein
MIVQETNPKTNYIKIFRVASNFTTVEIDPIHNRILFLKENKTVEIIKMKKENRYVIKEI